MTIMYVAGGGLESNVPSNTINKIETVQVVNDRTSFSGAENSLFTDVIASLAVNNGSPATGGRGTDTVEEIRQNALAFFNSQNRVVSVQDYTVRAYAMPAKFGGAAKVFVAQDGQINGILASSLGEVGANPDDAIFATDKVGSNVINLYTLGFDQNKKLVNLNMDVKSNLRTYIDQYRILTDEIRILDAFVVNIGINFEIIVFKNQNMNEVLARSINALTNFFNIDRWSINQPIILSDLFSELASVEGVQSVSKLEVVNKYKFQDGSDYNDFIYDINHATENGVIYPSLDPCVFELRYPENDIIGGARQ
jgi:hypothetical protein